MDKDYKYILEPYKGMNTRYTCPSCGYKKQFALYIDTTTGEILGEEVGRCNREEKCGYHYSPKQYFEDNNIVDTDTPHTVKRVIPKPLNDAPTSLIDTGLFKASLGNYELNNLFKFMAKRFGTKLATRAFKRYNIGTSKHWQGACVFWQVCPNGDVRAGKVMLYNEDTGKRVKKPFNYISWVHSVIGLENYNLKQCLFGLHLLDSYNKPIGIVESEKTAIIASLYMPEFIWMATGGIQNIKTELFKPLTGRKVYFFPDCRAYGKWYERAEKLSGLIDFNVSEYIEKNTTEDQYKDGIDIADILLKEDLQKNRLLEAFKYSIEKAIDSDTWAPEDNRQVDTYRKYVQMGVSPIEAKKIVQRIADTGGNRMTG